MKWAVWNEIRKVLISPYLRLVFGFNGISWGREWRILGVPIIQKFPGSNINIGRGLVMRSWMNSNPVAPYHPVILSTRFEEAEILIGDQFGITGGSIVAAQSIKIGNRVLVGGNCLITDTDFHPLNKEDRIQDPKQVSGRPVVIGDDVFIGTQSLILKGSRIGPGSIIGAGSVVSGEIPANVVAAGNPAVIIRHLEQ